MVFAGKSGVQAFIDAGFPPRSRHAAEQAAHALLRKT
jgi:hypothetical protein